MKFQQTLVCTILGIAVGCTGGEKSITVTNRAPTVAFTSPANGAVFDEMSPVSIYGTADDNGPLEDLTLQWSSSIDGILPDFDPPDADGNVEMHTASLSEGIHVITLQVTDMGALQGEVEVNASADFESLRASVASLVFGGGHGVAPSSVRLFSAVSGGIGQRFGLGLFLPILS